MHIIRQCLLAASLVMAATISAPIQKSYAATAEELNADGRAALNRLNAQSSKAARFARSARAILVFPRIVKAGLLIGGQGGEGVLFVRGRATGYYRISGVSYGLQVGGQSFSYVLFFMNDKSLEYLNSSDGWSIGSGPSVVIMDKGKAMSNTSMTITQDVYAFPFGQSGLMAGLGLEGSKITQISK
jgi:lipid-binding SYLF domain-containing protein